MLVLTRKSGEGIWIGDDIQVKILEVRENHVKVGIVAPAEKGIYRNELYSRIRQENIKASKIEEEDIDSLPDSL